ncbi:hypothetical protein E2C01_078622 [Portunus trituberculatus]|uniref:Uncharacterized protein n=1 Tax=Portunus trituberculatus TaxID=210409 RepID=A0A5B7IET3_PORTR|nr:hypothetical protein [Portunus trituberculatus]
MGVYFASTGREWSPCQSLLIPSCSPPSSSTRTQSSQVC